MEETLIIGRGPRRHQLDSLASAAHDLHVYGFPLLEMARARRRTMGRAANVFTHVRRLADASSRMVTTPNNDTLYSSAWLDLRAGPVEIEIPETGGRYISLALLDLYTNNFVVAGPADEGTGRRTLRIVPPDAAAGPGEVIAPTWWVWAQVRTLVEGPADLAAARAVQNAIVLRASERPGPAPAMETDGDPYREMQAMDALVRTEAPAPAPAQALLASIAAAGLTTERLAAGDDAVRAAVAVGTQAARNSIDARLALDKAEGGWILPAANLGDFGTDYLYRASIALWGLGALPTREAMYMRAASDAADGLFDGRLVHVLRFAPGELPPVSAFWSLSLYAAEADGRLYLAANPLGRHAIGDRTPGLVTAADGSLEIWMSALPPPDERRTNWLPAPAGPFALILRAYSPRAPLREGQYRLPRVVRHDP